ncbi:methylmalonyl-CoA epimerase [Actinosynnema sp. NPDC059335]|uniref:methylmalonyl-CoA epimerase n=1 Tax=Actinosynnema sp. NPDC059335 TaxID=3346804 RepID=UPI00366CDA83
MTSTLPVTGVLRVDHVGLVVADLEAAVARYETLFGMRCEGIEVNVEQGVREAMLQVASDPAGTRVQLLSPIATDSAVARFLERSGPGVQQIAYTVADLDAAVAGLRAHGVRFLYDTPRRGTAGSRMTFLNPNDVGGILVELVEPAR